VGVSDLRHKALQQAGKPIPTPVLIKALIDTGASHTVIDSTVISQLGLTPTGSVQVLTPTTGLIPCEQLTYDLGIFVPLAKGMQPWAFLFWTASEADLQHQGFSMLYGRDLLAGSTFHYDGQAQQFTLTF
jgi:hypothetical protein